MKTISLSCQIPSHNIIISLCPPMRKCDLLFLQVFTILFFQLSNSCVISHVCVCVRVCVCVCARACVVYYNKLIQKSLVSFSCVCLCVCAHVCAGAHGDHRHWLPRGEVPCSYEPQIRVWVTEPESSAESVRALNQWATYLYHTNQHSKKCLFYFLCVWVLFACMPVH